MYPDETGNSPVENHDATAPAPDSVPTPPPAPAAPPAPEVSVPPAPEAPPAPQYAPPAPEAPVAPPAAPQYVSPPAASAAPAAPAAAPAPQYAPAAPAAPEDEEVKKQATTAMVFGIIGMVLFWSGIGGVVFGIIGLIKGVGTLKKAEKFSQAWGFSIAAIALSAGALVLGVIYLFVWLFAALAGITAANLNY